MIRTRIYITEEERRALRSPARQSGRKLSELIRAAVDRYIGESHHEARRSLLHSGRGIWKNRPHLPVFADIRKAVDRFTAWDD